jgi:hypothetical protein
MSAARLPHPLSDELVKLMSERMAVLGDLTRTRILDQLLAVSATCRGSSTS